MNIAYFVNQYPKVSHSFIRREINALERLGHIVERFAIRANYDELVDSQDKDEFKKTRYLLNASVWTIAAVIFQSLFTGPIRFFRTLWFALLLGWNSDRGLLNHLFYFVEACLLKKWLDEVKVLHVHAHFGTNPAAVVMLTRRLGGPPYSFTVHGPEEFDKPEFLSLGEKIRNSAFTVAISSYGRSQLYRWVEHSYWKKVKVVHCGLDAEFHKYSGLEGNYSHNIVCVGRLCEQKGQLLLVEAIATLVADGIGIHLTLAGDGLMRVDVEKMITKYKLESNITITGWISSNQVRDEILNARALVLPSFAEGLPVVIMEAMALKRPVLSTYVAGIPELVEPGNNGWLVPAGDVDLLKETILQVLDTSNSELDRIAANAREKVIARHDIDKEAGKLSELFKQSVAESFK